MENDSNNFIYSIRRSSSGSSSGNLLPLPLAGVNMIYAVPSEDWDKVSNSGDVNRIIDYLYLTSWELTKMVNSQQAVTENLYTTIKQQADEIGKLEYVVELQKLVIEGYQDERP